MTKYYLPDFLFSLDGPPRRGGAVAVERGRIAGILDVLPAGLDEADVIRLPGAALLPGLINCHTHLELEGLGEPPLPGLSFGDWARHLMTRRGGRTEGEAATAVEKAVCLALQTGTTTLCDIGNTGISWPTLFMSPLRAFGLLELLEPDPGKAQTALDLARGQVGLESGGEKGLAGSRGGKSIPFRRGLTCHAPFTCSAELLRLTAAEAARAGTPCSIHAAESLDEQELFQTGTGALAVLCRERFGGVAPLHPKGSLDLLLERGALPPGSLVVHGNLPEAGDAERLAAGRIAVVHCPHSHAYFGNPEFPYETYHRAGVNACLGSDSGFSGGQLDLFQELRLFRERHPTLPAIEVLQLATVNGARALGLEDLTGRLRPGMEADLVAVKVTGGDVEGALEQITRGAGRVILTVAAGAEVWS